MSEVLVAINGHTVHIHPSHELYQPLVRVVHEAYGDSSLLDCLVKKEV